MTDSPELPLEGEELDEQVSCFVGVKKCILIALFVLYDDVLNVTQLREYYPNS